MRGRETFGRRLAGLILLALLAAPAHPADVFYTRLLREGAAAHDRGEHDAAARQLRIACFGLLDEPDLLAVGLSRLALAQAAGGDLLALGETFRRLIEIEERFQAYSSAELPAAVREELAARFAELPDREALVGAESFVQLLSNPPGERPEPAPAAPAPQGRLEAIRAACRQATEDEELGSALEDARGLAGEFPAWREAQHLAAETAYRASRWQEAVKYFRLGGDPGDERPALLFYLAVSLYETGEVEAAAAALERALPGLERDAFVESYSGKILAPEGPPERRR